jgi:hypothetical protein
MKTKLTILVSALLTLAAFSVSAQTAAMKKEQCLACHGPTFEDLIKKNVQAQSDSGPVNPHVWIPHAGGPEKQATECIECHSQHPMPPKKGYKDESVSLEPCYACHHNYQLKACSSCHNDK